MQRLKSWIPKDLFFMGTIEVDSDGDIKFNIAGGSQVIAPKHVDDLIAWLKKAKEVGNQVKESRNGN